MINSKDGWSLGQKVVSEKVAEDATFELEWLKLYFARWSKKGTGSEGTVQLSHDYMRVHGYLVRINKYALREEFN